MGRTGGSIGNVCIEMLAHLLFLLLLVSSVLRPSWCLESRRSRRSSPCLASTQPPSLHRWHHLAGLVQPPPSCRLRHVFLHWHATICGHLGSPVPRRVLRWCRPVFLRLHRSLLVRLASCNSLSLQTWLKTTNHMELGRRQLYLPRCRGEALIASPDLDHPPSSDEEISGYNDNGDTTKRITRTCSLSTVDILSHHQSEDELHKFLKGERKCFEASLRMSICILDEIIRIHKTPSGSMGSGKERNFRSCKVLVDPEGRTGQQHGCADLWLHVRPQLSRTHPRRIAQRRVNDGVIKPLQSTTKAAQVELITVKTHRSNP